MSNVVNLKLKHNPHPLGDRCDAILLAHMISKIDDVTVNLISSARNMEYLSKTLGFADVVVNSSQHDASKTYEWHNRNSTFYLKYSKQLKTIPLKAQVESRGIKLPDRFVTTQWDAQQRYRDVRDSDPNRVPRIEQYYKDQGYKIVNIGGQSDIIDLRDIIYTISKAHMHVGADSGMSHVAKFLLPIENIHTYINIDIRQNDERFPDNWSVNYMARDMFRRGARMNFCENPDQSQINYFKDVELYNI